MSEPTAPPPPPTWRDRLDLIAGGDLPDPIRLLGAVAVAVAVVVGGWLLLRDPAPPVESTLPMAEPASTTVPAPVEVVAHVSGAVARPGLYTVGAGARVADLVTAAGGPAGDADLDRLNLAALVVDGAKVHVPTVGEPMPTTGPGGGAGSLVGPLDLNTASEDELDELPGVGPATAAAIVQARTRGGPFRAVDDLLEVRGIGPAKLEAIRELVRV